MRKTIINGGVGSKVICVVTNDELEALPIKGTDNGDGTASLTTDSTMDVLPDTTAGDLAAINSASASIDGKLPALVDGKIPVDASVSIDSVDIGGDVDIKEFPAGNLGQQLKAASLSVAPATDIADATYIGDVKFGEELPAGTQIIGKVGIDQTTPGTTNLVNVNGGASQSADIKVTLDSESVAVTGPLTDTELRASDVKVTLDSESVAVTGPLTDAQLTTQALAKESTLGSIKTAAESLAVATPDTAAGDLASMSADLGTVQTDLATVKADIALMKADLAKKLEKLQLHVAIDFSSASAQTIIDAPVAGNRIRLTRLSLISGSDPQVNVEIALKSGTTTIETVKGDAMVFDYPEHRNLGTDEAFVVQCTTADRVIGGVDYYVEAV